MKQLILIFLLFFLSANFFQGHALTPVPQSVTSVINNYMYIQKYINDSSIPQVVEFEVPTSKPSSYLIVEDSTQTTQPFTITFSTHPVPYSVSSSKNATNESSFLTDSSEQTFIEYSLDETEQTGQVNIFLRYDEPVTANTLTLDLRDFAQIPDEVAISTVSPDSRLVLARTNLYASSINFPTTTAQVFSISLYYSQPLLLSKISLNAEATGSPSMNYFLRFLTRPNESYTIYSSPEGSFSTPQTPESGNLTNPTSEVIRISSPQILQNPLFAVPDSDGDGIDDRQDNCKMISNPDQTDRNNNGIGDSCEDFDNDGILNIDDNCPEHPNTSQKDNDGDGVGDHCDPEESRLTEQLSFIPWIGIGLSFAVVIILFIKTAMENKRPQIIEKKREESSESESK